MRLEDRWQIEAQLEMYIKFMPTAKRWGTIYNSGRVNSKFYMKELRQVSKRMGLELVEAPITQKAMRSRKLLSRWWVGWMRYMARRMIL